MFFQKPFFGWAGGSRTANCHTDRGGRAWTDRGCGRKTLNCRRFWPPPLLSSRLKSVYSHRDRGGPGRETQNCRRFWLRLLSSQRDCGVFVAKCRTVVALGLACGPRVSKNVNSHRDLDVVVAKCRSVNSHKDSGVLCLVWMLQQGSTCF